MDTLLAVRGFIYYLVETLLWFFEGLRMFLLDYKFFKEQFFNIADDLHFDKEILDFYLFKSIFLTGGY